MFVLVSESAIFISSFGTRYDSFLIQIKYLGYLNSFSRVLFIK